MIFIATKTPVTLPTAQQIIHLHFGSEANIAAFQELTDGMFNAAYQIDLVDGMRCVLKVAPPPGVRVLRYEKNIMQAEVEVMQRVRQQTEMPVPRILAYDRSCTILPSQYYLMDFVPGESLHKLRKGMSDEQQRRIDSEAGRLLRQMNAIQGEFFGYYAQEDARSASWKESFDRLLVNVLQDGQEMNVQLPMPYEALHDLLKAHYASLDEVASPHLVHWDLWDGNIFLDPYTYALTGLIDFERAIWADPLMEVNFLFMVHNDAFMQGYGVEMMDTPAKRIRRTLYNIYLDLIMVIECYYRRFDNDWQENWARGLLVEQLNLLGAGLPPPTG